jgi:hypothetical protein
LCPHGSGKSRKCTAASEVLHEFLMTVQEYYIAYCGYTEAVKIVRVLLWLNSLKKTCKVCQWGETLGWRGDHSLTKLENLAVTSS